MGVVVTVVVVAIVVAVVIGGFVASVVTLSCADWDGRAGLAV